MSLKILVVGNFSDVKCGFQNFSMQTVRALLNAGHDVCPYDGTYSVVYARQQDPLTSPYAFLPPGAWDMDVIHTVWHPATLNHYNGADWEGLRRNQRRPILSVWNGCPAAWCPFTDLMDVRWGVLGREEGHRQIWYPIPDWVEGLPEPDKEFTVGYSGVRGDGLPLLKEVCEQQGWKTNFSEPGVWLSQEEEIRRLARSTVNVCWYSAEHDDRSGSAMVCLASKRPLLVNDVPMMTHLKPYTEADVYMPACGLEEALLQLRVTAREQSEILLKPKQILSDLSWSSAVTVLEEGWMACKP